MESICSSCKFRKTITGEKQKITCGAMVASTNDDLVSELLIEFANIGMLGFEVHPENGIAIECIPELKSYPGCGAWPLAFDENIVVNCPLKINID